MVGDTLVLFGGKEREDAPVDPSAHLLDMLRCEWDEVPSTLAQVPRGARSSHVAVVHESQVFFHGGADASGKRSFDVLAFDAADQKWRTPPQVCNAESVVGARRASHSACVVATPGAPI